MEVSFIGGGNRIKPPTCRKLLTNFITLSYFNSVGHVNLFLNMACIMNGVTKKQRLTKQNPLKVFYYNKIIEVKTLLSVKKITKQLHIT